MKKDYLKYLKPAVLAVMLSFIYGCGPGAGAGSLIGFLFGNGGDIGGGTIALLGGGSAAGGGIAAGGGAELATLHQPEPASMLLFGSGLMVMTYFKSKASRRNK
jgi:hypothetical protein